MVRKTLATLSLALLVVACGGGSKSGAQFISGPRVHDIRKPSQPKEIAYFNTGANDPGNPLIVARYGG